MSDALAIGGAIVGGVVGFFVGGPAGAIWGATAGFGLGATISVLKGDVPHPGKPQTSEFTISTAKEGLVIPDILGTTKVTGNIVFYTNNRSVEQTEEIEGGKGGSPSQSGVVGYKYYLTWAMGICAGPGDELYTVYRDDEPVWNGNLTIPASGGEATIDLDGMGSMTLFFGTTDQVAPSVMTDALDDSTLSPAYRNRVYAFFNDCCIGEYNRAPTIRFIFRKSPSFSFSSLNIIGSRSNSASRVERSEA